MLLNRAVVLCLSTIIFVAIGFDSDHVLGQDGSRALETVLFDGGFDRIPPGRLMPVVGPHTEYHFLSEAVAVGPWAVTSFDSGGDTQTAWRAIRDSDGRYGIAQMTTTKAKHWHPMVVAGDHRWSDYQVSFTLKPIDAKGRYGLAFRQRNDRCYYFAGIDKERLVLMTVQHETDFQVPSETILAEEKLSLNAGDELKLIATANGPKLQLEFGRVKLEANDETYSSGCIALLANTPAQFFALKVTSTPEEAARVQTANRKWHDEETALAAKLPRPKLWKNISTPQFGTDRNVRFGDLNHDGKLDILIGQIRHHGPTDSNSELGCLTAVDLEGNILWQQGTPDRWAHHLTNDTALQIHDLDGDGKNEVVCCRNFELQVLEGATGKSVRSIPTPKNESTRVPFNRYPQILGDSLAFADFRGQGHRGDIILKDRYQNAWAYDNQLKLLWNVQCNTGHYPFPIDTDGDGREELSIGYSRISPDGKVIWTHDSLFNDHADSVAVVDLDGDSKLETLWGGSDEGFIMLDAAGIPRRHLRIGHVQNLTIANVRDDSPGLEVVTANFWKNQGLIHVVDRQGNVIADFEPRPEHGSSIVPVNWSGGDTELILVNPDPVHGGLYDGYGHRVVTVPADGHPSKAYDALDLTGDARDELIVWDSQEIWIYTQDSPSPQPVTASKRNSLSNESNYRARVSIRN